MAAKKKKKAPKSSLTVLNQNHLIAIFSGMSGLLTLGIFFLLYLIASLNIPDISSLASYQPAVTSSIYDEQNNIVQLVFRENRTLVPISKMPDLLPKAFVAAEDARFFQHSGVDSWSIFRALVHNLWSGSRGQGGSTITQQVARSLLLSPEKTYSRKLKEAILAYRIDKVLSKEEILHIYLNQIYLGEGAYGVGAAALTYYGKQVDGLTLAEFSLLAGLPQAPSRYSPLKNLKLAKKRQAYVLNRMAEEGYITPTSARSAYEKELYWAADFTTPDEYQYYLQHVKNVVQEKYGDNLLTTGGLKIYTALSPPLQKSATEAVVDGIEAWRKRHETSEIELPQAGLIAIEAKTGNVRALVGGLDFSTSQFNRATQARRQPGSAFKPIIYAAALSKGMSPNTIIIDEPVAFKSSRTGKLWQPKNFDGQYHGPTTLRNALTHSRNIVTIKLLQEADMNTVIALSKKMGIRSKLSRNLALALGSSEVSLHDLTSAYSVFAHEGLYQRPIFISKIVDRHGNILEENRPLPQSVLDDRIAFQITSMLKDVIKEGTGKNARGIPYAAGKTGTTDQNIDAWFVGYTPNMVTGVWVGFDQYRSLGTRETGGRVAAPIWRAFMQSVEIYKKTVQDFPVPEGITFIPINRETGDFEYVDTDNALWEVFRKNNLPSWNDRIKR